MSTPNTYAAKAIRMLYDRKSAAEQLSISVRSLDYLIGRQDIPTRRIGGRVLIRHEDLKAFSRGNHTRHLVPVNSSPAEDLHVED